MKETSRVAEIHAAQPVAWDLEAEPYLPVAFNQVAIAVLRRRFRRALQRSNRAHKARACAAVLIPSDNAAETFRRGMC